MKKLITSAGLVVLGAASLEAQQIYSPAPGLTPTQMTKPWSVSAAVRGFYDDNYALTPSSGIPNGAGGTIKPQSSWGFEVTPSVGLNWTMEQTYLGLNYTYDLKDYVDRPSNNLDQSHMANVKLTHAFTDRYKLDLSDSFVYTSEPDLVAPGNAPNSTVRTRQTVIRNYGAATFSAGLTEQLSLVLGYSNTLYDYFDNGPGSLAAVLNRIEQLPALNLRYQVLPTTVALVGYQLGIMKYTGNQDTLIPNPNNTAQTLMSNQRNNYSHYGYVGVDHSFNPQFETSIRGGVQFQRYDDIPGGNIDHTDPYIDANLTYRMTPDSAAQLGVRHSDMATDASALGQQNTTVYASVNYRILPPLVGSLVGQYQFNKFQNGQVVGPVNYAGQSENFWLLGLNLSYEINKFLSADMGYNFDRNDSDIASRSFTRNRVFFGLRASY